MNGSSFRELLDGTRRSPSEEGCEAAPAESGEAGPAWRSMRTAIWWDDEPTLNHLPRRAALTPQQRKRRKNKMGSGGGAGGASAHGSAANLPSLSTKSTPGTPVPNARGAASACSSPHATPVSRVHHDSEQQQQQQHPNHTMSVSRETVLRRLTAQDRVSVAGDGAGGVGGGSLHVRLQASQALGRHRGGSWHRGRGPGSTRGAGPAR